MLLLLELVEKCVQLVLVFPDYEMLQELASVEALALCIIALPFKTEQSPHFV